MLVISLKTVDSHKSVILAECRVAWGLDEGERLTYHFLRGEVPGPFMGKVNTDWGREIGGLSDRCSEIVQM